MLDHSRTTFKGHTAMQFEGDMTLAKSPEQAWPKLTNVQFLVQCIPNVEKISEASETHAVCVLRPGLAFVRGTLEVTIDRIAHDEANRQAEFRLVSKGIGSSSEVTARFDCMPKEGGSDVHWRADIQKLGGLLKAVPQGLIRGAAQKTIGDVLAGVAAKVDKEV
jgi:carbon monoxide dehydrogenase subunit G